VFACYGQAGDYRLALGFGGSGSTSRATTAGIAVDRPRGTLVIGGSFAGKLDVGGTAPLTSASVGYADGFLTVQKEP